jgi:predicted esterase
MTAIHEGQPIMTYGAALNDASAAAILVHGRGASARSILGLAPAIAQPGLAFLAPQAANGTWYPYRFLEPIQRNEPYLSSALAVLAGLVRQVNEAGIATEKILLLGFSQGACLSLEFAARNATRYAGVIGLSGGVIGPDGTPRDYPGSLDGTPVFLGCSDFDPHIPEARVHEAAAVMTKLGGAVTERIYPGMGHTVNDDEIAFVRALTESLMQA